MQKKRSKQIHRLVLMALMTALCAVMTLVVRVPVPLSGGYVNPGDGFVLLAGFLLGAFPGAFAAALGSAVADFIGGYAIYIPATFVIKFLMALVMAAFCRAGTGDKGNRPSLWRLIPGALLGECVMVAGYFFYEWGIFGLEAALGALPGNLIQTLGGIILAPALSAALAAAGFRDRTWF